eukprot:gnl/TRDRNA2_/TRDRNA2_84157_c0_seq1.p1 gnl/TRDRNA2_/TRDRNA2_84157_c0~~gnl/TRDRNA2_/TRDRNA2_84157_c0_seq1.p1  ORF type:complete len:335 (+),score=54.52 gnl/TRDRNA2_/TRDRNA2_84157_c0_seq1:71-1075(+)
MLLAPCLLSALVVGALICPACTHEPLRDEDEVSFVQLKEKACKDSANATNEGILQLATKGHANTTLQDMSAGTTWNMRMMMILDRKYLSAFTCWAKMYLHSGSKAHVEVLTLDEDSADHVQRWQAEAGEPSRITVKRRQNTVDGVQGLSLLQVKFPSPKVLNLFYPTLRSALQDGDVLNTDADAILIRSPDGFFRDVLAQHPDVDIIASIGFHRPMDVVNDWGFALNPGFGFFRKTAPVMRMVDHLAAATHVPSIMDALNHHLTALGCHWSHKLEKNHTQDVPSVGRCGDMKLVAVPWSHMNRDWSAKGLSTDETLVYHPSTREPLHFKKVERC